MEFLSIETMIKLKVGDYIVKDYMKLIYQLYTEALIESEKLRIEEENNLINY